MHQKIQILLLSSFLLLTGALFAQNQIDLSGKWMVQLENQVEKHPIQLPGSLAESGYGTKSTKADFGILTPSYKYIGVAKYSKTINIPDEWRDKTIFLFLERVLWQSKVFVDGLEIDIQDALGTPHIHHLGSLKPGTHTLTVEVDNNMIYNIGDKGHAYSDYTQSIWNGIVGRINLFAKDPVYIKRVRTIPDITRDQLRIALDMVADQAVHGAFSMKIIDIKTGKTVKTTSTNEKIPKGDSTISVTLDLEGKLQKWSEYTPETYQLEVNLNAGQYSDKVKTEFGFVHFSHDKTHFLVNGKPVFLRGNLDCIHFPLTGYPSTSVNDWERIFKIYKDYGLNHVRFHSWCPPQAAFTAANRIGIYIQAEASIWIDWWMSQDMKAKGRPEMDTKGHPKGLGENPEADRFAVAEMNRVVDFYGNNPSFMLFCIGNELGNSDFDVMASWIKALKEKDPRRLYSVSTARIITEVDDYIATHHIKDLGRTRGLNGPGTDWDFEHVYGKMNIPVIAHEIGQWPVYPSWKEIGKYKGVLKAWNLESFRAKAVKNGIDDQDEDFRKASGALNQIMYKYEIESFLRTKSCAGVQLLSMQDYQGQGEALIGWLDAFWDSKGITTPEKFRQHFSETVPLLRIEKYVWHTGEKLTGKVQLFHYGQAPINNANLRLSIIDQNGNIVKNQSWPVKNISSGKLLEVGVFTFAPPANEEAGKYTIRLELEDSPYKNEWNVWVFPEKPKQNENDQILITKHFDQKTIQALKSGKKVFLEAYQLGDDTTSVEVDFYPLYWSLTFFPGQGKTSIGMLIKDKHPAFKHFPTSYHSDWQWETFGKSKAFILNDLPKSYKPIVQVVDDFHRNNKEGIVFEFQAGKGKLLVCGFNLSGKNVPVAQQLKYSLLNYMNSNDFNPSLKIKLEDLYKMLPEIPVAENVQVETGLKNRLLHIQAGGNITKMESSSDWTPQSDSIILKNKNTSYQVDAKGVWKDQHVSAWHGEEMQIEILCPQGMLGTLYVRFNDWNRKKRTGLLEFEGRKIKLDTHMGEQGKWVAFHVMREDSNDGKIILKTRALTGGNLMIDEMILVRD